MAKIEYEMAEEDLKNILGACKPTRVIALQCGTPSSPQERANAAWKELGEKMGFDHMTVKPISDKGDRFFLAEKKKE